jgi:hypothetical protein
MLGPKFFFQKRPSRYLATACLVLLCLVSGPSYAIPVPKSEPPEWASGSTREKRSTRAKVEPSALNRHRNQFSLQRYRDVRLQDLAVGACFQDGWRDTPPGASSSWAAVVFGTQKFTSSTRPARVERKSNQAR